MDKRSNPEMDDLLTHQAGATRLHETRKTKEPVQINPAPPPGPVSEKE
ncbi:MULTISPECIES: hypothetical protein [Paenibacillus]|uniref:Spore protein n=1 Tax=Paenibacillus vulneris TaxID=1133364 RepID=A0ABW3UG81_9BACL|nr:MULTISPECIES: hypothetical protein [unclassified Paenibacillus]MBE1442125.1 hypothetical protein [Paenibacillus sp. OAS669]